MARHRNDRYQTLGALGRNLLPYASPRSRLIWEPVFSAAPASKVQEMTVPDLPRMPLEESSGTMGPTANTYAAGTGASAFTGTAQRPLGTLWWVLAGVAAMLVGIGASFGAAKVVAMNKGRDAPAAETGGEVEGISASGSTTYALRLKVNPPNASIELDGKPVATGSFTGTFTLDARKHTLRISAPDHETRTFEFDQTAVPAENVVLTPKATEAPAGSASKTRKKPPVRWVAPPPPPEPKPAPTQPPGPKIKTDNRDPWEAN
jgi:hypothetical protein